MAIIEVNNVTKEYQLGQLVKLKDTVFNLLARLRGKELVPRKKFKALDNLNFTIEEGEVVGVIGTNGAGKSTLLKILSGITTPTNGSIKVKGKVAPLIEVGAGLVPDLTGRENIFLNGAILGMRRAEIEKKFDEIVAFAEIEEFIDTPIKRYSSGMQVRLGFSIATSIDADILIVDEVLAVGDLAFQRKCFDRMENLIKNQGKTVLLVSHNIRQIQRICDRAILLDHGGVLLDGDATEVANRFYERSNEKIKLEHARNSGVNINSTGQVNLLSIDIIDDAGQPIEEIQSGDKLIVRVQLEFKEELKGVEIVIGTHRTDFLYLTAGTTAVFEKVFDFDVGVHEVEYTAPEFPVVAGQYCIRVAVFDRLRGVIFAGETLKTFAVIIDPQESILPPARSLNYPLRMKVDKKEYRWRC